MFLNGSQRTVFDKLVELGRAKLYSKPIDGLEVSPRMLPLLYGPTGAGKTFLAESAAKELRAKFIKVEVSSWIPTGARNGVYTIDLLKDVLLGDDPVVFFVDEIDKLADDTGGWTRGVQAEVWSTLDVSRTKSNLFLIGAGTWQDEHGKWTPGFGAQERQVEFGGIPKELLHRFSHLLPLSYPSQLETAEIFERTGLLKLADELGIELNPATHDWTGGMRSIERVCTELVLARRKVVEAQRARTEELLRRLIRPWSGRIPDDNSSLGV